MSIPNWWGDWRQGLTPHTGNLQSTDLIECTMIVAGQPVNTVITGAQILGAVPTPSVAWGSITGTLSSQTDLSTALSGKASTGAVTGTGITMSTARILGRSTAGTGAIEEITIGTGLTLSAGTLSASGGGLTVGTTAIASGTVGRILFEGTGNVLQESSQLSWNNTTNALTLTTGKTFSAYQSGTVLNDALKITASNDGAVFGVQNSNAIGFSGIEYLNNSGAVKVFTGFNNNNGTEFRFNNVATNGYIDFLISSTSAFRVFTSRNIGISQTTDAGYKLDVNGTARVQSTLTVTSSSSNGALSLTQNSVGFAAQYIYRPNVTNTIATLMFQDLKSGANSKSFSLGIGRSGDPQWTNSDFIFGFYTGSGGWQQSAKIFNASGNWAIENGTATSDITTAILQVNSTTKGFLPPRMTNAQMLAIATPAAGLVVYDTTNNKHCGYNGTAWQNFY